MPRGAVDLVPSVAYVAVGASQTMDQFDLATDIEARLRANDPPVVDAIINYLQGLKGTNPAVHLDFFAKHLEETIEPFNSLRRAYLVNRYATLAKEDLPPRDIEETCYLLRMAARELNGMLVDVDALCVHDAHRQDLRVGQLVNFRTVQLGIIKKIPSPDIVIVHDEFTKQDYQCQSRDLVVLGKSTSKSIVDRTLQNISENLASLAQVLNVPLSELTDFFRTQHGYFDILPFLGSSQRKEGFRLLMKVSAENAKCEMQGPRERKVMVMQSDQMPEDTTKKAGKRKKKPNGPGNEIGSGSSGAKRVRGPRDCVLCKEKCAIFPESNPPQPGAKAKLCTQCAKAAGTWFTRPDSRRAGKAHTVVCESDSDESDDSD